MYRIWRAGLSSNYPGKGKLQEALLTLAGFAVGKPVLIEETFPLKCSPHEFEQFIDQSSKHAAGWLGFYWESMTVAISTGAAGLASV